MNKFYGLKKILSVLLIILCLSSSVIYAEGTEIVFKVKSVSGECGGEVVVPVELSGGINVASFTLDIEFDKTAVTPLSVTKTEGLNGQLVANTQYKDNVLRIVYASDKNASSMGDILNIIFKISEYQKGGIETPLKANLEFLADENLEDVRGKAENASITIAENPNYVEAEAKHIVISSLNTTAGEEAVLSVYTGEILDVCTGSFTIAYDSGIEIIKCEAGEILKDLNPMINLEKETRRIKMNFMGLAPISKAGELMKITLSVKSNETKDYKFSLNSAEMFKLDETYVPVTAKDGLVSATEKVSDSGSSNGGSTSGGGGSSGGGNKNSDSKNDEPKEEKEEIKQEEKTEVKKAMAFSDIAEKDWYYSYVKYAFENGLMNGTSEKTFAPEENLTRAMFVTVLYRMEKEPETKTENISFADVEKGSWYEKAVAWANENKIVMGSSEKEFSPNDFITREQMAVIVHRFAGYRNLEITKSENSAFADSVDISKYAKDAVGWISEIGIMNGNPDKTFRPLLNSTRAEAAAVFMRIAEKL